MSDAEYPGAGYRIVGHDEVLREGDEWAADSYTWVLTENPGIVAGALPGMTYRRKLGPGETAPAPPPSVVDTLRQENERLQKQVEYLQQQLLALQADANLCVCGARGLP